MKLKEKIYYPRVLSVSGGERNVGKTTFSCELIKKISREYPITAIKISPHHHQVKDLPLLTKKTGQYSIYREEDPLKDKDSARMLSSGAHSAYYIESREGYAGEAFQVCLDSVPADHLIICENGSLTRYIEPALAFFIKNGTQKKKSCKDDNLIQIDRDNDFFRNTIDLIYFNKEKWHINQQQ